MQWYTQYSLIVILISIMYRLKWWSQPVFFQFDQQSNPIIQNQQWSLKRRQLPWKQYMYWPLYHQSINVLNEIIYTSSLYERMMKGKFGARRVEKRDQTTDIVIQDTTVPLWSGFEGLSELRFIWRILWITLSTHSSTYSNNFSNRNEATWRVNTQ